MHIALVWPERSQIATLVTTMLEDYARRSARWNQSGRSVGAGAYLTLDLGTGNLQVKPVRSPEWSAEGPLAPEV